jgi:two-component system response regulator DevR
LGGEMTRVLLVDDHEVVRAGLRALLEDADDFDVCGEAATAAEAIRRVGLDEPDVVLMDVRLPDGSGIDACRTIRDRFPDVRVLILTSFADEAALLKAAAAGASGFELKRADVTRLVGNVRRVARGESLFTTELLDEMNQRRLRTDTLLDRLSEREADVARLLALGWTNRRIATELFLAEKTVKNYVSSILAKMEMTRRSEVAAYIAERQARPVQPQSWDD